MSQKTDGSTPTEVFPCFFLSCKVNVRVYLAKTGHGPHSSLIVLFHVLLVLFYVLFCVDCVIHVLFVCKCILLLPGVNPTAVKYIISCIISHHIIYHISHHIISYHIISYHIISYHIISYIISCIISHHISYHHIISYHIISYHITSNRRTALKFNFTKTTGKLPKFLFHLYAILAQSCLC